MVHRTISVLIAPYMMKDARRLSRSRGSSFFLTQTSLPRNLSSSRRNIEGSLGLITKRGLRVPSVSSRNLSPLRRNCRFHHEKRGFLLRNPPSCPVSRSKRFHQGLSSLSKRTTPSSCLETAEVYCRLGFLPETQRNLCHVGYLILPSVLQTARLRPFVAAQHL